MQDDKQESSSKKDRKKAQESMLVQSLKKASGFSIKDWIGQFKAYAVPETGSDKPTGSGDIIKELASYFVMLVIGLMIVVPAYRNMNILSFFPGIVAVVFGLMGMVFTIFLSRNQKKRDS